MKVVKKSPNNIDLQERAECILGDLNLIDLLSEYGETYLVGNVLFKTTVKPDIDIQIYSLPSNWQIISDSIINRFLDMGLSQFVQRELEQCGKHLTSFDYVDEKNTRWTIDITQTEPSESYLKDSYRFYLDYKDKLTEEKVNIIRGLKQHFHNENKLYHSMGYYIYRAVLDKEATTPEDIYSYLGSK